MLFIPDDVAASLLATLDSAVASQLPMSFGQLRAQLSSAMQGPQQAISQQQTPATCLPESTTPLPLLPERVPGPSISRRMNTSPYERPRRVGRCHSLPPVRRVVLLDEDILGDSPLEAPADNWPLQPPLPLSPDLTTGQTSTGSSPTMYSASPVHPCQPTTAGKVVFPLDLTSIRPSRSPMRSPSPISPLSPSQSPSPQYRWLAVGENANNPANNPGLDEEDHDVHMQDHFGTHHGPLPVGTSLKRPAAAFEEEGEDEDTAPNLSGIKITIPSVRDPRRCVAAGGAGGGGGGAPPAHLWTDDCIRRGDRGSIGTDANIGHMSCGQEDCEQCQGEEGAGGQDGGEGEEGEDDEQQGRNNKQTGKRARRKKNIGWRQDGDGPAITRGAGELLAKILGIFGRAQRLSLEAVLAGPSSSASSSSSELANNIPGLLVKLTAQSKTLRTTELEYMVNLIQLALHVDNVKADAKLKHLRKVTTEALSAKYTGSVPSPMFSDWVSWGKRLLLLCSAGTLYLLPVLAALDLRTHITRKSTSMADILSLANALREVKHGQWLPMTLKLEYNVPLPVGKPPETKIFKFADSVLSDEIFDSVETNYPKLPPRSSEWKFESLPSWKPLEDPELLKLPDRHVIQTPLNLRKSKCPVNRKNRNTWTEEQRRVAQDANVASSLADLEAKLKDIHETGQSKPNCYVEINTDILDGLENVTY
ncbi:hypothetical protein B0H10DRAFT_2226136 [Mycena sp. CBHHK59/15]|nr:hypothetical protein B0H10DRAFT_2226136 [Mycena sp. CBHHK59/15]